VTYFRFIDSLLAEQKGQIYFSYSS